VSRRLTAHGLSIAVPPGWDARIFLRGTSERTVPGSDVPMSGVVMPVLHLADFPLPEIRGDYGSGAVQAMGRDDVFVALVEFGPESAGTPMFSRRGVPRLRTSELGAQAMQRPQAGMAGVQRFFTEAGRPCCLYAVIGSSARRPVLVGRINDVLGGLRISPR